MGSTKPGPAAEAAPSGGMNVVVLRGRVSRPPEARELPSGDVLVAYEVSVGAGSGGADRTETVPVVWPAPPAGATGIGAGEEVVVAGRVRRRFFRAGGVIQSRTEVVADQVVAARQRARAAKVVAAAVERLAGRG